MKRIFKGKSRNSLKKISSLLISYLAFKTYSKYKNVDGTYRNLQKLKPIYKNNPNYYYRLSKLAYEKKQWKESLKHIDKAIELSDDFSVIHYYMLKADNLIQLGHSTQAKAYLEDYLLTERNDDQAWYTLAKEYKKDKQWKEAVRKFQSYLDLIPTDSRGYFELAECYRNQKEYEKAELNYQLSIDNLKQKQNKDLLISSYYWLGYMQLKNNKTIYEKTFDKVIKLDKKLNSKKFGIGIFHEYFKQWESAVEAYKEKLLENNKEARIYVKLASVLDKQLNQDKQAIVYYEKALEIDKVMSPWHFALANCYEQIKDYKNAAKWFESAIARQQKHRPGNYRRLAFVYDQLGRVEEALEVYKEAEIFSKGTFNDVGLYKKHIRKPRVRYAISYEHYDIDDKIIFYESMSGSRMMDSPYAIFESLIKKDDFKEYVHVWVLNSFDVIPEKFRSMNNIIFIKRKSDAYYKYITSAKYLICNSTFDPYVVRKQDQLYLQTSHGIFYKTVGRDSPGSMKGVAGSTRNLLQATHIIVPNEYMAKKQPKSYSIRDIHSGKIAKIGYPRIDATINMNEKEKWDIANKLKINLDKKTLLYVPTWRGRTKSENRFDTEKLIEDLKMLAELDVNVLFRGHPISNSLLNKFKIPKNIIIPQAEILTNELLGIADLVISDYSSVFFDFLVTNRPIVHYLYDIDVYKKERGLNFNEDELPGVIAKTSEELKNAVKEKLQNNKPNTHYLAAKKRFCPYDDGQSTDRIINWFFYDNTQDINIIPKSKKFKSIHLVGDVNNIELTQIDKKYKNIKENDNIYSILFNNQTIKNEKEKKVLSKINSNINFIVKDKNMPMTIKEIHSFNYFKTYGNFISKDMEETYNRAYKREARRLFGDSLFDEVINYNTSTPYYNALAKNMYKTD